MPHFADELHFRRPLGIFFGKIQMGFEKSSFAESDDNDNE
jgi:hypothetical protein